MTHITRRMFLAATATIPVLPAFRVDAAPFGPIALFDPTLDAGSRFARRAGELDMSVFELDRDRVRHFKAILAGRPESVWGVSRQSDRLLAGGLMREHGYRAKVMLRCLSGETVKNIDGINAASSRTSASGSGEAFAEIAAGYCLAYEIPAEESDRAAIFWSFQRVR